MKLRRFSVEAVQLRDGRVSIKSIHAAEYTALMLVVQYDGDGKHEYRRARLDHQIGEHRIVYDSSGSGQDNQQ